MFIRAVYRGQKKKIRATDKPSFEFLIKELVRCFGDAIKTANIGYYDEDKEFIRLTNDEDWEICVEETQLKNKGKEVWTVEVHVLGNEEKTDIKDSTISESTQSFVNAPLEETTNSEIQDWRIVDKIEEDEHKSFVDDISNPSIYIPNEPSIFEEPSTEEIKTECLNHNFISDGQNDVVIDLKITGTPEEIERTKKTIIHQFAPHAGFEIERCEVLSKRESQEMMLSEEFETESILDNESQMSQMTTQLKDEIESLIEEKLKKLSLYRDEPKLKKKITATNISCGDYNHGCVTCDNCLKNISGGARYKSLIKRDYDLCENCEATGIHQEPMIKIRNPIGHYIGMKLNQEFDYLFNIFEPKKVIVEQHLPCHIRKPNIGMMEKLVNAENCLKSSIAAVKTESKKMDIEKLAPIQKIPTLCHIRPAPKVEKIEAEAPKIKEELKVEETPKVEVKLANKNNTHTISMLSRMFPNHDSKVITEFIDKNQKEGLSLEELTNKFLDLSL